MNQTNNDESDEKKPFGDVVDDILEIGIMIDEESNPSFSQLEKSDNNNKEADLERHPPASDDKTEILAEIKDLGRRLDQLATHFEGKIKYDEHKNQIIDDLHRQLQHFRDGLIKKHLLSMITDIIKVIDDTRKFKAHYENAEHPETTPNILLDFMGQIASDIEDIFTFQGIYQFTHTENTFDSARQRIIKKVETDDPEKNRLIAESLRPGYEWDGKVIRPEMVSIYTYNDQNDKAGDS